MTEPTEPNDLLPLSPPVYHVLLALALITLVALITYAGRDGYVDPEDSEISLLDAFYYSTVSITTTGYGDIRPVTDDAHLPTVAAAMRELRRTIRRLFDDG